MYKVLFVCTGNICRSPIAEGVLRQQLKTLGLENKIHVDSAGTHGYHVGEAPDLRAVQTARRHGIGIDGLRARQLCADDFSEFDLILALDSSHFRFLHHARPDDASARIELFLKYAGAASGQDVPDPYYGQMSDFEYTFDLLQSHMPAILDRIQASLESSACAAPCY